MSMYGVVVLDQYLFLSEVVYSSSPECSQYGGSEDLIFSVNL